MRYLFTHDPAAHQIVEAHEVARSCQRDREFLRLEMLLRCYYPCDVFDSDESGTPCVVNRRWVVASTRHCHQPTMT